VAEIRGRVVRVHPELAGGALLAAGTELLRIDTAEYELQVARLEASIQQVESQLAELAVRQENLEASIEIERLSLELARQALERSASLRERGSASQAQVDTDERSVLAQRQSVQNLSSQLELIPSQRAALEASLGVQRAQLAQAELDVGRAVLSAPFDCRLAPVSIEVGQFVAAGEMLFEAHGTAVTEVEAQLSLTRARTLLQPSRAVQLVPGVAMDLLREIFDVEASVRLRGQGETIEWEARFDRVREGLQASTRTIGIVVAVDEPYAQAAPGVRPPLVAGMFCEVELRGPPRPGLVPVPRAAVHGGLAHVLDEENRLQRREVEVAFEQGGVACISGGLSEGDRLVVSDPTPAVIGMLVEPVVDADLARRLEAAARGETTLR
jgi:multidrug efflux pump subunit AcrA (membrane-fusion protein)